MFTLNCKGKLLALDRPVVMGIVNITNDSFYTGQLNDSINDICKKVEKMLAEGAAIIDIGGQSTRPGSSRLSAEEEVSRVVPVIKAVKEQFPEVILSIDTYHSNVARQAVEAGASVVNDISTGEMDANMIVTVAALQVPYVCMHMQGRPETMQDHPSYTDITREVLDFFIRKIDVCQTAGINDIIIDPGFGFGKTATHNFELLHKLSVLSITRKPILAGLSRKGTITRTLNVSPEEALNGTTVMNTIALLNGASILRVHDVKEAVEAIALTEAYKKSCPNGAASL